MAVVIIKLKVMPVSPDVNLRSTAEKIKKEISSFGGKVKEFIEEPVAFGLKALIFNFNLDESKGATDVLEDKIRELDEVQSTDVISVSRALG